MIFKSLFIQNIRSYGNAKIEFPLGISLFEGDIGSGKSTILMAIEFALFGLGNQRGDSLIRKNTLKGSVILEFEVEGKNGKIERTLLRKTKDSPVKQDKGILTFERARWQLSPSEMKEKILELLDFKEPLNPRANSYIFRYAVYTPQEEMKEIILQKPESRLQTLRKAFGIEDYKIAAENAFLILRYLKDKTNYLAGQTSDLIDKKSELDELKTDKENKESYLAEIILLGEDIGKKMNIESEEILELQEVTSRIKEIKAGIPHLIKQIDDKRELSNQYHHEIQIAEEENLIKFSPIIEKLETIEKPINETQENLNKKIKSIKEIIKKREALLANLNLLNDDKCEIEDDLGENKNKNLDELQYGKEILDSKIKKHDDLVSLQIEKVNGISEEIYKCDIRKTDITEKIGNLDGLEGTCPICGTLLDTIHKQNLKNEKEKEISKIDDKIQRLNDLRSKENKELESRKIELKRFENNLVNLKSLIDRISGLNTLKDRLKVIKGTLRKLDEDISFVINDYREFGSIEGYIEYLEKTLDKLKDFERSRENLNNAKYQFEKNINKIKDDNQMIIVLQDDIRRLEDDLTVAKGKSEELDVILKQMNQLQSDYKITKDKFQDIQNKIVSTQTLVQTLEGSIDKVGDEIKRKEELKSQLHRLNEYQRWLVDYFIPTVSLIENHVMNSRLKEFNDNFQKWFNILIDDETKTAKLNEEFTPIVQQDKFEQDMNYLSGGEKTSVALAYRLALNNVVKNVSTGMKSNLLILDEPTDGFSKEQLFKVREILNELDCPQIIIVSHERELESFADTVFRVEKIDGISIVNQISN